MFVRGHPVFQVAVLAFGFAMTSAAVAQDEDVPREECLQYSEVQAIHRLSETDMLLEVAGTPTVYRITVEARCFRGDIENDITIRGSGEDGCMRTTDRVHFGRRECGIEGVELIETEERLDAVLAGRYE